MIIHVHEIEPYGDQTNACFVDLGRIDATSPKELQEYKEILEEAVALGVENIRVHSRRTITDGHIKEKDISFAKLPCVVTPPCLVDASVRVAIFYCDCPCHDNNNKKGMHIMTCIPQDARFNCQ